jgi:hypothetical protein
MNDLIDQSSVQSPMAFSCGQAQFAYDALRSGVRAILILGQDSSSAHVPDETLAGYESASVRLLRIGQPLPSLFELQDMVAGAAGVTGSFGLAPKALARLLLTSVPPWQSIVLAIDDAEALPRQSLYYLAQVSAALPADARILQIVLAGGPALLEQLDHPDFATFRNGVFVANEKNSEQEDDRIKGQPTQARGLQLIAPRPVQIPPLLRTEKPALRLTGKNLLAGGFAICCLLAIAYAAFLAYSDDDTPPSASAINANAPQDFAAAPQSFPPAPPDARATDEAMASLIGQFEAAMVRELSAPRPSGEAANLADRIEALANGASPSGRLMVVALKDRIAERVIEALRAGRSDEAHRLEQFLGRSGNSRNDPGRVVAADSPGASPNDAQSQSEEHLAIEAERKRLEEETKKEAERLAFDPGPVVSPAAPKTPAGPPAPTQPAAVQGETATAVSVDLPALAPSRVVLAYPRTDKAAAERTAAVREALTAAKVEVVDLEAVDASRLTPSIGYYFRSDRDAAVGVSRRLESLLGSIEPAVLEVGGKVPPPGTIEIALPGRGAR